MMNMYGSHLCPDVREAIEVLEAQEIKFQFLDITTDLSHLKAFLQIRDTSPLFDAVRDAGGIGIPCFEKENGEITLDVEDLVK
jgi:glutaredoxin-related protein